MFNRFSKLKERILYILQIIILIFNILLITIIPK